MCVEYWLNYQINDCVGIIAELHESFSDCELGVGSPKCIELAKAHSKAVDYAKTGIAAQIPKNVGIPLPVSSVKYPHHMGKHQAISYKSTSIKGILYNSVRIPSKLWRDKEFRKTYNLKNNQVTFCPNPYDVVEHGRDAGYGGHLSYQREGPKQPQLTNRERLRERLMRGCEICGIPSFDNAHFMNQHKDDPLHKRNKQMARDKAMLQRIKDAKINAQYKTNIPSPNELVDDTANSNRHHISNNRSNPSHSHPSHSAHHQNHQNHHHRGHGQHGHQQHGYSQQSMGFNSNNNNGYGGGNNRVDNNNMGDAVIPPLPPSQQRDQHGNRSGDRQHVNNRFSSGRFGDYHTRNHSTASHQVTNSLIFLKIQ